MQPERAATNAPIARLVGGLFVVAAGTGAATFAIAPPRHTGWLDVAVLTALLTAAEYLILRFRHSDDIHAVNLFEAALAPMLFAFPGLVTIGAVLVAQTVASVVRRNTLMKGSFNVAQWTSAAGAGSLLFIGLRHGAALSPRNVASLVLALLVVATANQLAFTMCMRLVQHRTFRDTLRSLAPMFIPGWVMGWPVNTSLGVLFVVAHAWNAATAALFAPPLFALHWAYRAYGSAETDRRRISGLQRATRILAVPVDPRVAIPSFLEAVRECFDAESAELVIVTDGTHRMHRLAATYEECDQPGSDTLTAALMGRGTAVRITAHDRSDTGRLLAAAGKRDCIAAPVVREGVVAGVLCLFNRAGVEGFEAGELGVLQALAQEAANAIDKAQLLDAFFDERRKLADIVGHTSDGIVTLDADGSVRLWNPGFERLSGYDADEMSAPHAAVLLQARDVEGHLVSLERWAEPSVSLPSDVQITTREGRTRWLSCSYTRVDDTSGAPGTLIVVARDVTGAREIERLKDDFVATVSHELRTPLTPIKAWAQTLLSLGPGLSLEQQHEGLRSMLRQSERLERLITNLLQVSKVERGVSEQHDRVVDIDQVAAKVVDDYRAAYPSRHFRLSRPTGQATARGDEMWVEQILGNLLSNAVKYSPADEPIEVTVRVTSGDVTVSVADRGPGIPTQERESIFERFHRLGDHMTRAQGGAGLGLYIARQLAQSIGGTLNVDGEPGKGTVFTLRLRASDRLVVVA